MSKPALNIRDLSPEERLSLIEELWDSLNEKPENVPLTTAQREELDRRLDDLERSGPDGIPWDQVMQQIRSRPTRSTIASRNTVGLCNRKAN
jgi:putative addiction module component (TIGR02574 family)